MATPIPRNHAEIAFADVLRETGGILVGGPAPDAVIGVSTDTRHLEPGELFVAIRGETFDAHDHLDEAFAKGARVALIERDAAAPAGLACVRVSSTLEALGALAREWTRKWRMLGGLRRVIAITGSAGKTTTRVALAALLEAIAPGEVHATAGNLNNLIGVPMTLLGLGPQHRAVVLEMGTNRPGEIAALTAIAEPDAGIVTLIAAAHVEGFGSIDAIAEEKAALFLGLGVDAVAVGNADDPRVLAALARSLATHKVTFGRAPDADYRITVREPAGLTHGRVHVERHSPAGPAAPASVEFRTPLLGEAGALACAAAIAVVERLVGHSISGEMMSEAMEHADIGGGAGRLLPRLCADGLALIDDSYNANPASMCASIRAASEIARSEERRLVLVLGAMRELGAVSAAAHDEVGRAAGESGAALVIAVHGEAARIAAIARTNGVEALFAEDIGRAIELAREKIRSSDLVLVKGSRGVATERIVASLVAAHDVERAARGEGAS